MERERCPHCFVLLTEAETRRPTCSTCGKPLDAAAPRASNHAAPNQPAFSPGPRFAGRPAGAPGGVASGCVSNLAARVGGVVLVLAVIGALTFGRELYDKYWANNARVYVDNGSMRAIDVYLDGRKKLTLGPMQTGQFGCRAGEREIEARVGDEVLFSAKRKLRAGVGKSPSRYLLHPDGAHGYWVDEVRYGANLPQMQTPGLDDIFHTLEDRYDEVARLVRLLPDDGAWRETPGDVDHVFASEVPEKVEAFFSASRKVVLPMTRADYDTIAKAQKREGPVTEQDLAALIACVERVLETGK